MIGPDASQVRRLFDAARAAFGGANVGLLVGARPSTADTGLPEGIISSFPVRSKGGSWEIVQGLKVNDFSRQRIDASVAELVEERDAVKELGLI